MLRGIDDNWNKDLIIGVLIGLGFMLAGTISPFIGTIGIPNVSQSLAGEIGKYLIVIVGAAIFEEIFFREFILDFFDEKLKGFGMDLPYLIAAVISSILFALFHFVAYSGSLRAAGGDFMSAALVGFAFAYLRKQTNSILPSIVAHGIINAWILTRLSIVV